MAAYHVEFQQTSRIPSASKPNRCVYTPQAPRFLLGIAIESNDIPHVHNLRSNHNPAMRNPARLAYTTVITGAENG